MTKVRERHTSQVDKKHIGKLGEEITVRYLMSKGYTIVETNYLIKGGEIDIVAQKGGLLLFCEVKTVRVLKPVSQNSQSIVSRETYPIWQNITKHKIQAMKRAVYTFLSSKKIPRETHRLFGFIVSLDTKNKGAEIKVIPDINI